MKSKNNRCDLFTFVKVFAQLTFAILLLLLLLLALS